MKIVYKNSKNFVYAYVLEFFHKYVNGKSINTSNSVYKFARLDSIKKEHIIGHLTIVCLALNLIKAMQFKLKKNYEKHNKISKNEKYNLDDLTLERIIYTLRKINITKADTNEDFYIPSFTRTILTDMLSDEYKISFSKQVIGGKRIKKAMSV